MTGQTCLLASVSMSTGLGQPVFWVPPPVQGPDQKGGWRGHFSCQSLFILVGAAVMGRVRPQQLRQLLLFERHSYWVTEEEDRLEMRLKHINKFTESCRVSEVVLCLVGFSPAGTSASPEILLLTVS